VNRPINLFPGIFLLISLGAAAADEEFTDEKWDVNNPPGKAKTISIDTRSGTWMSLDVSPDGKTIAFDLLGDIYVLPMAGGEARSINSGLAWSIQPRFSPDGSEIAFISDAGGGDNIWTMQADGSEARQLTHEDFRMLNNHFIFAYVNGETWYDVHPALQEIAKFKDALQKLQGKKKTVKP